MIVAAIMGVVFSLTMLAVWACVVMLGWNLSVSPMFGAPEATFFNSAGIVILADAARAARYSVSVESKP